MSKDIRIKLFAPIIKRLCSEFDRIISFSMLPCGEKAPCTSNCKKWLANKCK